MSLEKNHSGFYWCYTVDIPREHWTLVIARLSACTIAVYELQTPKSD